MEIVWLNPSQITNKISPHHDLHGVQGGDWDIQRRHVFADTAKARAMVQRYRGGADWMETDLFADAYTRRLKRDGHIGGVRSLADLAEQYRQRWDAIAADMKRGGFRLTSATGKAHSLPVLLIGRGGEVFIGNQGNHRLALAQVLGLEKFAGKVLCRHPLSQQ